MMPSRSSQPEVRVSRPAAARALVSATRQEIVDALASAGPSTVAQLADLLGRKPDALYFHLRALERVGLVVAKSEQQGNSHSPVVYEIPGAIVRLDYDAAPRSDLNRVVRNALRLSLREFERECIADRPIGKGSARHLWGGRVMGWINDAELARINTLIAELHEIFRSGRPGPNRRAMSLGFLLAPSGLGERVRNSKSASAKRPKHTRAVRKG